MTFFCKNPFFRFSVISLLLLAPQAHAASTCHYIEQAILVIAPGNRAQAATVNGEINGTAVNMALDTGSTQTSLLRTAAENLGLTPARTRRQTQGVGGSTSIFTVKLKDFAVGNAHVKNRDFQVLEAMEDSGAAGIIGNDYLLQYDVELDFAENRAKLYRAEQCQEKALAYWDADASAVPMEIMSESTLPRVKIKSTASRCGR